MANGMGPDPRQQPRSPGVHAPQADVVHEAAQMARDQAGAMWNDAKATTRSRLNEQKDVAAEGLGDVARALRDAAMRRDPDDGVARLSSTAAEGLERVSSALRDRDVGAMLHDVDRFARRQPMAFLGLAVAAGFLAVRLLKDTDVARDDRHDLRDARAGIPEAHGADRATRFD